MKKQTISIILVTAAILFGGCTTTDTPQPGGTRYPDTHQNYPPQQEPGTIPPQGEAYGLEYDLSGYLLPVKTLENGTVTKRFAVTTQESDGYFSSTRTEIVRTLEGITDDLDRPIVNVFEGEAPYQQRVESYLVDDRRISVTFYDTNDNITSQEQYPRYLQVGSDLLRNQDGACVLQSHITDFDMGNVPVQAEPNGHYHSVLHVKCGTASGDSIDRYYADGWGQILAIRESSDGTTVYSVFDQSSYIEQ